MVDKIDYENRMKAAEFLRERMAGRSLRQVAEEAKTHNLTMPTNTLSNFLSKGVSDMQVSSLAALCVLFKTTPNEFMELLGLWSEDK
jgi:hypothetical protein